MRPSELTLFGEAVAKVELEALSRLRQKPDGHLIFVSCITPTKEGEGKTTNAIGLVQGLGAIGARAIVCLREPSLAPIFGRKGGATGTGRSRIIPDESVNLHFTGDGYAISTAHNLLAAVLDNQLFRGNLLDMDPDRVFLRRVIDIGDRMLREVTLSSGAGKRALTRRTGFDITPASEVMAILTLSRSWPELIKKLDGMIVAASRKNKPIRSQALQVTGAMAALLRDALKPNLVQTLEGQPAFVHGGPYANVSHGSNSLVATSLALKLADYVVTEGGFGFDLGGEKFLHLICRQGNLKPSLIVLVVSVKAVRHHGGFDNLDHHVACVRKFGLIPFVLINRFPGDGSRDLAGIQSHCESLGVSAGVSEVATRGGKGAVEIARSIVALLSKQRSAFRPLYRDSDPFETKLETIARDVYGAEGVDLTPEGRRDLDVLASWGLDRLPLNVAKTQYSLSDDPQKRGVPKGWRLTVREIRAFAGAGYLIPVTGQISLMPGLPVHPQAEKIRLDRNGQIHGLI